MRMRLLPEAVADTVLDVHETYVYQPLRKGLEKVAALSFFPRAVLPNHVTWMSMVTGRHSNQGPPFEPRTHRSASADHLHPRPCLQPRPHPHPHPHPSPCQACALPFVLLTVYGWHFAAAALTIFHDMLDRLDGTPLPAYSSTCTPASMQAGCPSWRCSWAS